MEYYKNLDLKDIEYYCEVDLIDKVEQWVDVLGYEGFYMVSDLGRVKSLDKNDFMFRNNCSRIRKGIILKGSYCKGYRNVCLYLNRKSKTILTHRVVLSSWVNNVKNKREVNHINCIKDDNRLFNLEWSTSSENTIHAIKNGLVNQKRGEDIVTSKLTEIEAYKIKNSNLKLKDLSIIYNISISVVCSIKNNNSWKHVRKEV